MKTLIGLILIASLSFGCNKVVTIPAPLPAPDIAPAIQKISESNMPPEAKAAAITQVAAAHQSDLAYLQRTYEELLARAHEAGTNVSNGFTQALGLIASVIAATLAATK